MRRFISFGPPLALVAHLVACDPPTSDLDAAAGDSGVDDASATDTPMPDASTPDDGGGTGCSAAELTTLEAEMAAALDEGITDPDISTNPNFVLLLESDGGRRFTHAHGDATPTTEYESASTSKWVTAVVILELVDRGVLSLDTRANELLPFWTETEVQLRHLLSFTSGYADDPRCVNSPTADFAACVEETFTSNVATATPPGSVYQYGSGHLQIAGLMAIRAAGAADWAELFEAFKARTGLFATGRYDLPSLTNPRLAGGMTWTAEEYLGFLRALQRGEILTADTTAALLANQRGAATLTTSPAFAGMHEDWSYGFGNWLECRTATEIGTYDCGPGERNSSAGAYGAYPFLDRDDHYFGVIAQQGRLGSGDEGTRLFRTIEDRAARWASCD
jgi:CubicO group peptidase (beta-lactamase class C family)